MKLQATEKENLLAEIFEDLSLTKVYIHKILEEIRLNEVSKYPIFVLSKTDISLGVKIIEKSDFDTKWNFNVSHLEEFVSKKIISIEKAPDFIEVYKKKENHLCLFIQLSAEEADFAYVKKNQI